MNLSKIKVRKVDPLEIEKLQNIGRQTFVETFSSHNFESDMEIYLNENLSLDKLKSEFKKPGSEYYFAEIDNLIVGYLKLNRGSAQTEATIDNAMEIERIYVLKKFHGKQVGQLLYNKAQQIAESNSADFLWLGVWEKNPRAIRFYQKNGFVN